jgi:outer membrane receptor for ferrienterochelin and colicin
MQHLWVMPTTPKKDFTYTMKTLFTILFVACGLVAFSQGSVKIIGQVNDSTSNKPVEFATVALTDPGTGKTIDGAVCDARGKFTLSKVTPGKYVVTVSFIGYDTKKIQVNIDDKKDADLGTIAISTAAKLLNEVTVEGQKALIEERVDRTVYNAENDATTKGGDASDVLKRVPLLSVDMDGNVSLRGNQNVTVLINNKPSSVVASSIADALKQIAADQIKSVEVITAPSAKYDAEGSAGIINIITKKNTLQGLTLNVDAAADVRGSNLGLNGNYRKGKMGLSLGGFGRYNYNIRGEFESEQIGLDPVNGTVTSINTQSAKNRNRGLFGNYNLGWDYDINDKNLLAASVRFGLRGFNNFQDGLRSRQYNSDGTMANSSLRDVEMMVDGNNVDMSLTYTRLYAKPQRELSFMGLYSHSNNDSDFENFVLNETDLSITDRIKNINDSYNQEMTFQVDYVTPLNTNQMFEVGAKSIMRKVYSDFVYYTATGANGEYVLDASANLSNNLNYDQNVTSGYMSYTYSTKSGYSLKAGSRYEYTAISAYTKTESDIKIDPYGVLVPSVNLSKKLKGGNMIRASYNRRIQRPSIKFLNPNVQAANPLNIMVGDPKLDPEFTNNYELTWTTAVKGTNINMTAFHRNTNGGIQPVRDMIKNDSSNPDTVRTRFMNIGQENAYGVSAFANFVIGKLSFNVFSDAYYVDLDNNVPDPLYRAANRGWVYSGRIFGSYTFKKGWGVNFFTLARSPQVLLQGEVSRFYMYSVGVRKEFKDKRGSIGIGSENFMQRYLAMTNRFESPMLIQAGTNRMYNANVRISFSYRFGKMGNQKPKRKLKTINNDDLKDGGGDGGDGGGTQPVAPTQGGGGPQPAPKTGPVQPNKTTTTTPTVTKPADGTVVEAAGTWTIKIDAPPQGDNGTIVIRKENGAYTGTIKTDRLPQETAFTSVTVNGTEVIMKYSLTMNGNSVPIEIKTNINTTDMAGTMAFGTMRTFTVSGKRQ